VRTHRLSREKTLRLSAVATANMLVSRIVLLGLLPLCAAFSVPHALRLRGSQISVAGCLPIRHVSHPFKAIQTSRRPQHAWVLRTKASGSETAEESLDDLIERMAASPPYELPGIVAKV
jgi:hypothetical protein